MTAFWEEVESEVVKIRECFNNGDFVRPFELATISNDQFYWVLWAIKKGFSDEMILDGIVGAGIAAEVIAKRLDKDVRSHT